MFPLPPRSPLFPYTTLFRSSGISPLGIPVGEHSPQWRRDRMSLVGGETIGAEMIEIDERVELPASVDEVWAVLSDRSEEHTSELQSRLHLVCRLLLEKKKQT